MHTPFFPAFDGFFAPGGGPLAATVKTVRAYTLCQLEVRCGRWLPDYLFPKAAAGPNSRDRVYTRPRTFWSMLWQALNPKASCREVVRQLQALFLLHDGPGLSEADGAYCRAKARLPQTYFPKALARSAQAAERLAPTTAFLQGRCVKVADGTALTLADTPKNRQAYPPVQQGRPNFPLLRVVALCSLLSGAILSVATANLHTAELPLLYSLFGQLVPQDILMGDRGFGNYVLLALLQHLKLQVDFIGRSSRRIDGRRCRQRLGHNDWLVCWQKGTKPSAWLPRLLWDALPKEMTVRIVRAQCRVKGFRVRQITVVTTLLDAERYPAREILQVYLRRWRLEMCLDDLKTTLEMETLRSRTPTLVTKELYARLIAHNLVRCVMAQTASEHGVPLERLSFKGTLDALRQFTQAMSQARTKQKAKALWSKLLETLAADQVPERPGRREPRAVKRVKNKYPRLSVSRHKFKDRPKRSVRQTVARRRRMELK